MMILFISFCGSPANQIKMSEVDKILTKQAEKNKTPSVQYIIFNEDRIIHLFQRGFADIKNKKNIDQKTTFNWYSTTKTFTALAILQLAEKKQLDIDNTITNYLPNYWYSSNITIRQLMAHSAGIPNPNPLSWIHLADEHPDFNRDYFFDQVFKKHNRLKSKPNEKFAYSNLGYVLLGQLLEKVSGQTYEDYIRDHIIEPLGILSKELDFEIFDKNLHAKGYQKRITLLNLALGFILDKSKFMNDAEGQWKPFKNFYVNGTSYGGLVGNSNAMVTYIQELLKPNCRLISDEYKEILFNENLTSSNKETGMCLSWFKGKLMGTPYFHHAGGGGGYYCEIRIYPELGIGSVIMFNRTGIRDERYLDKMDKYFLKGDQIK